MKRKLVAQNKTNPMNKEHEKNALIIGFVYFF